MTAIASSNEAAAKLSGEVQIYLETGTQIDGPAFKSQLHYQYASGRPHHNPADWDSAFGEPRGIDSERDFIKERDRVIEIFTKLRKEREAEILH